MDTMQIANSLPMWLACGVCVGLIIVQSIIFCSKSYRAGEKLGLTKKQMLSAVKGSAVTSIGPSLVILSGMLSLLLTVGGPMAWMRLSFIGSVMYESLAAGFGTGAIGIQLGVDQLTDQALAMAVWTMILGSLGWIIVSTVFADKMSKVQEKIAGTDTKKFTAISAAAAVAAYSNMVSQKLVLLDKNALACLLGAVIMGVMLVITKNPKFAKLKQWNLTIAIFAATIIVAIL